MSIQSSRNSIQYLLALSVLSLCVYSLGFPGTLLFDDLPNLASNSSLQLDGTVFDAWRVAVLSSNAGPTGRPVSMFSFALNSVISDGVSAFGLKLTNTVIHIANAWLVFILSRQLLQIQSGRVKTSYFELTAFVAAAIWLLHPLQVSTVLYSVQRMAQLSTFFVLLGLIVFVRHRHRWATSSANLGDVLAAALWFGMITTAAVFSKENGAVLPALALLIELVFFGGLWAGRARLSGKGAISFLLVSAFVALAGMIYYAQDFVLAGYTIREFTLQERVFTQLRLLWQYLGWFIFPDLSAMGFQHDDIPLSKGLLEPLTTVVALLGWVAVLLVGVYYKRRFPFLIFGVLFFLVGHSLESGVLALEMVFEHRNYLPLVGISLLAAIFLLGVASRFELNKHLVVGLVVVVLSVLLAVRVSVWSDNSRLELVNLKNHPNSPKTNFMYAESLWQEYNLTASSTGSQSKQAMDQLISSRYHFQRVWELDPRSVAALIMLHHIDTQYFPKLGQRENWLGKLETLLEDRVLQSPDYNAIDALAMCTAEGGCSGDHGRMMSIFTILERRYPNSLAILSSYYTYIYAHGANAEELEEVCKKALSIEPGNRAFLARLLSLKVAQGDIDAMYEVVRQWMTFDKNRRDILHLKALFSS